MTPSHRPLKRRDAHVLLQLLLPLITVFAWYIAWSWFFISPEELANSIALRTLDELPLSLDAWACAIGVAAAVMTLALLRESRGLYVHALAVTAAVFVILAVVYVVAAANAAVSSSAWAWPAFVVVVCLACIKALTSREA